MVNRMSKETQGQQHWNKTKVRKKRQGLSFVLVEVHRWICLVSFFLFFLKLLLRGCPHFQKNHREDRKPPNYTGEVPWSKLPAHTNLGSSIQCHHYQSISNIEPLSAGKRKQEEGEREISFELKHHCRSEKEAHTHTKKREKRTRSAAARAEEETKKRCNK